MQNKQSKWHVWPIRVRYQETDKMGVVYHMNYLNWFEIGRTEMIRALGVTYHDLEQQGLYLPLTDAELSFKKAAQYDDPILIYTRVDEFGPLRIRFVSEARKVDEHIWQEMHLPMHEKTSNHAEPQGTLLVSGATRHVWLNHEWQPIRLESSHPQVYNLLKSLRDVGEASL
jgi:acyl-CoA thioester hydrolase